MGRTDKWSNQISRDIVCEHRVVLPLEVELPINLTNSNDGQGRSWHKSARLRKEYENILNSLYTQRRPFEFPVTIIITRVLGKRQRLWDADSGLRGSAKQLIDSLVAVGWFYDDGPKYVKEVRFRQDETRRESGPAVKIKVEKFFENSH